MAADEVETPRSWAQGTNEGWRLRLRVQPGAGRSRIVGRYGEALKVQLAAPANEGKANAELIRFLAERLRVPRRDVVLRSGERSRTKTVEVPPTADLTLLERDA